MPIIIFMAGWFVLFCAMLAKSDEARISFIIGGLTLVGLSCVVWEVLHV